MIVGADRFIEARNLPEDRRERILDAAQACFVRNGFDRTTMNDLARESAMSAANLYRYFDSKEALVVGLVEREAESGIALVGRLRREGDVRAELIGIIDQHYIDISRETAILRLDIWSEATRNPTIAALTERFDEGARHWLADTLAKLATSSACDLTSLRCIIETLLSGIVVGKAMGAGYDGGAARLHLHALLDAGLAGRHPATSEARG